MPEYRNTIEELKYFGSDFNKYLHGLTPEMTVNNIDTVQYKRSKHMLRMIEYKHETEPAIERSQHEVLHLFKHALVGLRDKIYINSSEVYVVRGDPPFKKITVTKLSTQEVRVFEGEDVKKWCEFDIEW